jgi:hypothetical protein
MKTLIKILFVIVFLPAVLLLVHPWWLAPAVKGIANSAVPGITKTEFHLGGMSLNAYRGEFSAADVLLGNPEGFDERVALKVGSVNVVADMGTVADDVIVLKEVTVKDVFLSYVYNDGVDNFTQISKNASSGDVQSGTSAQKPEAAKKTAGGDTAANRQGGTKEAKSKKVIIDRLRLSGITVKFGPIPLPVPPITLTDIGRKSNGVTLAELGSQLLNAVMNGVGSAKDGLGALGVLLGEGASDLKNHLKKGDTKAAQESFKKTGAAVKDAADALKSLFK